MNLVFEGGGGAVLASAGNMLAPPVHRGGFRDGFPGIPLNFDQEEIHCYLNCIWGTQNLNAGRLILIKD